MAAKRSFLAQKRKQPRVGLVNRWGTAVAFLLVLFATPVMAKSPPDATPTSSSSIKISVTVSSRYGLAFNEPHTGIDGLELADQEPFCIATNGNKPLLPVMLNTPTDEGNETGDPVGRVMQLKPCEASIGKANPGGAILELASGQLLIVRPE